VPNGANQWMSAPFPYPTPRCPPARARARAAGLLSRVGSGINSNKHKKHVDDQHKNIHVTQDKKKHMSKRAS